MKSTKINLGIFTRVFQFIYCSYSFLIRRSKMWLDRQASTFIRPEPKILFHKIYNPKRYDRLCIFAHYDPRNCIDPYVLYFLEKLKKLSLDLIFVSTCPTLRNVEQLNGVHQVLLREGEGLDFGSWYLGYQQSKNPKDYKQILFVNDSVFGPLYDLKPVFEQMEKKGCDLWGITDSFEKGYHLQSYFLVFEERVIQSGFLDQAWKNFRFFQNKENVIRNYEHGFSLLAKKRGFSIGALCPYEKLIRSDVQQEFPKSAQNPMLMFWNVLIEHFSVPFVKRALLTHNPFNVPSVNQWKSIIQSNSNYNCELIENYLKK